MPDGFVYKLSSSGSSSPNIQHEPSEAAFIEVDLSVGLEAVNEIWVNNGVVTYKTALPIVQDKITISADNADTVTFSNIPVGTVVSGVSIDDGILEFTTNHVGSHIFTFENQPEYLTKTFEVIAE